MLLRRNHFFNEKNHKILSLKKNVYLNFNNLILHLIINISFLIINIYLSLF